MLKLNLDPFKFDLGVLLHCALLRPLDCSALSTQASLIETLTACFHLDTAKACLNSALFSGSAGWGDGHTAPLGRWLKMRVMYRR